MLKPIKLVLPRHFVIEVPESCQDSESYILGLSILFLSMVFLFDIGTVPTEWSLSAFHSILIQNVMDTTTKF